MSPALREVARALLLDDAGRILLVHWRDPITRHEFLEPPGGAREPGESFEDALRREVAEETGVEGLTVARFVAEIDHEFTFGGRRYECRERYYVCRPTGGARRDTRLDPVEAEGIVGIGWWAVADLGASGLSLEPPALLELLRGLDEPGRGRGRD
ncbi:MAG TPA: NUDIX domain-containing protein [Actinomycetota bacterium]|nr:NUDIX domain-containing protein [Actinomycetota bacterium]